jgi:hypothetical protein
VSTEIKYEFYLRRSATDYAYKKPNGSPRPLIGCIENEANIYVGIERNPTYLGVFKIQSAELKFHGDAEKIIEQEYNSKFVNSYLELEVKKRDTTTQQFQPFGIFKFDWKTYKKTSTGIECKLVQGGLIEYIETNEDTKYQVPMQNLPAYYTVNMNGIILAGAQEWGTTNYVGGTVSSSIPAQNAGYFPLYPTSTYTEYQEIAAKTSKGTVGTANAVIALGTNPILTVNRAGTLNFSGNFYVYYKNTSSSIPIKLQLWAYVRTSSGNLVTRAMLWEDPNALTAGNDNTALVLINNSIFISVDPTQVVEFLLKLDDSVLLGSFQYSVQGESYIRVDTRFRLPQTNCNAKKYNDLLANLVQIMTDYKYKLNAPLLTSTGSSMDMVYNTLVVASSTSLSRYKVEWLTVSLNDFVKDLLSRDAVGFTIENEDLVVKRITDLYQKDNVIMSLGEVSNLEITPATGLIFNNLFIGYDAEQTDEINQQQAYNTRQEYKSNVMGKYDDKDFVSSFIADVFVIEKDRNASFQKNQNERNTDTDRIYLLQVDPNPISGVYQLKRGGTVEGLNFNIDAYNVPLTPGRALIRKKSEIASMLYKIPAPLKFQTSPKPVTLVSNLGDGFVTEKTPVDYSGAALLFQPIYFTFDYEKVGKNFLYLLQQKPYGVIRFSYQGKSYDGFVQEVGTEGDKARFKLLSSPNNTWQ